MQESSVQILLAEYDRLKTMAQVRTGNYESATQLYLTVISAAAGVLILLLDRQATSTTLFLYLGMLLGFVLFVGVITYLRLVGLDISLIEISEANTLIRDQFVKEDSELANVFFKSLTHEKKKYLEWASFRGIVTRGLKVSQQKTLVASLNSVVSTTLAVIIVWPSQSVWAGLALGIPVGILTGILHIIFASWRYKYVRGPHSVGVISFWF